MTIPGHPGAPSSEPPGTPHAAVPAISAPPTGGSPVPPQPVAPIAPVPPPVVSAPVSPPATASGGYPATGAAPPPPPPGLPLAPPNLDGWPAFVRELDATLAVHSQFVLWGNLHDSFLVPDLYTGQSQLMPLADVLWQVLRAAGYSFVAKYDRVDGVAVLPFSGPEADHARHAANQLLGKAVAERTIPSLEKLSGLLASLARPAQQTRAAFLIDYASRIPTDPGKLEPAEKDFFVFCEKLSRTSAPVRLASARPKPLYNPVIWLVNSPRDLPQWLTAENELIREIAIPRPHLGDRQATARLLSRAFAVVDVDNDPEAQRICDDFAKESDGLTLQSMIEVSRLAKDRGYSFAELPDAVTTYKLGVLDNPWKRGHLRKRISEGERKVPARVIGQPQATTKTLDILKRAVLGLSGAQAASSGGRPRGVLFFAGPTGTGKTELAKAITSLVFGDERAYLRFDMSEFSSEHAGDRLIGAPPGYVGFEAGGELTNAIREDPFRVILFDEIEKAHPRILDKFLQILEDGRLTDGRGNTCHFSESILIFTSNLGMYVEENGRRVPNVLPGTPYPELETALRTAIGDHFTTVLNRPELLNRFGDNIVIFDFISPEAASAIFDLQLDNIVRRVADEHEVTLTVEPDVRRTLQTWCTGALEKGGRGIGMALESLFVNPLARKLFDSEYTPGATIAVTGIGRNGTIVDLDLS